MESVELLLERGATVAYKNRKDGAILIRQYEPGSKDYIEIRIEEWDFISFMGQLEELMGKWC